jgi:peptidoglycan/xylan/chitin deacetylase (PgdA/CDA1 family)
MVENIPGPKAGSVAILTYHSIDTSGSVVSVAPREFVKQMRLLSQMGMRGISLREAVAYHSSNGAWPGRSVVLTFDDGYENFFKCALPSLSRYGFTATVFVVSGHMGGANDWAPPPEGLGELPILSWRQAAEISAAGIEIGSHTKRHPDLQKLSAREIEEEIGASQSEIESHIGGPVESFAYPFGSLDRASLGIVKRYFRAACTTFLRRAGNDQFHILPRVDMYYIRSDRALKRLLEGRLDYYLMIRRLGRGVRRALA